MTKTYSGFISILGPTNAGKSTLINQIMGRKVSIVSHKVQTTRTNLRAVKMVGKKQLIFVDTPGIFKPKRRLDRAMVGAAFDAFGDADAVLLLVDATHGVTDTIRGLIEKIKNHKNLFVALNKVDAISKSKLLPMVAELSGLAEFREIFMISAKTGEGVDKLRKYILDKAEYGDWIFNDDEITNIPIKFLASEITREKLFFKLKISFI